MAAFDPQEWIKACSDKDFNKALKLGIANVKKREATQKHCPQASLSTALLCLATQILLQACYSPPRAPGDLRSSICEHLNYDCGFIKAAIRLGEERLKKGNPYLDLTTGEWVEGVEGVKGVDVEPKSGPGLYLLAASDTPETKIGLSSVSASERGEAQVRKCTTLDTCLVVAHITYPEQLLGEDPASLRLLLLEGAEALFTLACGGLGAAASEYGSPISTRGFCRQACINGGEQPTTKSTSATPSASSGVAFFLLSSPL